MRTDERVGVLLINTGSTSAPEAAETRTYLRQFLSDPRVLDMNPVGRWLLLNAIILPFRPKRSAEAYRAVWTEAGSPLIAFSREQQKGLQERMPGVPVELGMRYGEPSIEDAFQALLKTNPDRIVVAPLFPQYASASNGSALELVYKIAGSAWNVPALSALPPFYADEGFLDSWVEVARPVLAELNPDHVLMSYHGLPERQVLKTDATGSHCLKKPDCCDRITGANQYCYRAQCYATTRELTERLGLSPDKVSTSFQSRLGRDPWLKPPTDEVVPELARRGIKRLAVMCPAFVTDCLETLEEIGIRAREDFLKSGGEALVQVPCLNAHPRWLDALAEMLRKL